MERSRRRRRKRLKLGREAVLELERVTGEDVALATTAAAEDALTSQGSDKRRRRRRRRKVNQPARGIVGGGGGGGDGSGEASNDEGLRGVEFVDRDQDADRITSRLMREAVITPAMASTVAAPGLPIRNYKVGSGGRDVCVSGRGCC